MIEIADPLNSYKEFPGPILILAGPGTGKTYQVAMRVKFLLHDLNVKPEEIAIITFTNEAARNMRERLLKEDIDLPSDRLPHVISTMHSLGNTIIGSRPEMFGLAQEYQVLTDLYLRSILIQDAAAISVGDRAKWQITDECRRNGNCQEEPESEKCQICAIYRKILRKCSTVDYDDQIFLACQAICNDDALAEEWRAKTRYLLVDEYQDINHAQYELISLLTQGQTDGLFAVGDDDQSIYSFRGGSPKYIRDFADHFEGKVKIGRLSKSWRCPEHILRGARGVVNKYYSGSVEKPPPTFSEKIEHNCKIKFLDVPSDTWEANIIADNIAKLIAENRIIVIIPYSNYFPLIRDALRRKRIPYHYKTSPAEDGIIRFTIIADWAENPKDSLVLRHFIELIIQNYNDLTGSINEEEIGIKEKKVTASDMIASLWEYVERNSCLFDVIELKSAATERIPFWKMLKEKCLDATLSLLDEHGGKRSHLPEFLRQTGLMVAPGRNPNRIISEIREWRNEVFEANFGAALPPVEIYNLPGSKGLEGDIVFVIGLTESLLPNPNSDIEEQCRLIFVAMTRAKKKLFLFNARKRSGGITFQKQSYQLKRSQFIDAIPQEHIEITQVYAKRPKTDKGT